MKQEILRNWLFFNPWPSIRNLESVPAGFFEKGHTYGMHAFGQGDNALLFRHTVKAVVVHHHQCGIGRECAELEGNLATQQQDYYVLFHSHMYESMVYNSACSHKVLKLNPYANMGA